MKALIDSNITHEEFILVNNEKQLFFRLKESIREKSDQLSDIERGRFIAHDKRTGENERLSLKRKTKIYNLLYKFIPEMNLDSLDLYIVLVDHSKKTKNNKTKIQGIA